MLSLADYLEEMLSPIQRRTLLGHSLDETACYYVSGLIAIDSQSVIYGREQNTKLINENTSMMSKRNLLAPMPPGSQLTDRAIPKVTETNMNITEVALVDRTPSQEYALRRQSRKLAYRRQREAFFEGDLVAASPSREGVNPLRSPSRYLQALWKFEPDRRAITMLMYPGCATAAEVVAERNKIPLNDILELMAEICRPEKTRYAYAFALPTKDGCCGVCGR
jgi:hypothetical protein